MLQAKLTLDRDFRVGQIDRRIYGSFLEHLGRAVYGGIYQPGHPTADDMGFRQDVMDMVRRVGVPVVRYPGGNFVSGFDWEDSVGPREKREPRLDLAWRTIESNEVGLHEFAQWAKRAGTEVMYAVNLGTRQPEDARNLLEYANLPGGTRYANLRVAHGHPEPYNIKLWCLGNEMDGCWQMGQKTARAYGEIARETAKLMRRVDPSVELVACGSSSSWMPTFGAWELEMLDECYDEVDYVSLHRYYENKDGNTANYLADALDMDDFIRTVVGVCDALKGKKRSKKTLQLSFDEWNVGYHARAQDAEIRRNAKPWSQHLPIMQDDYNFEDALFVGSMLMTLIRHADRVKIACLAQLVNAIAPIRTSDTACWAQTTYYPYLHAARYGRGQSLQVALDSPVYDAAEREGVPVIDAAATWHEERELTIFCLNRSCTEEVQFKLDLRAFGKLKPVEHIVLHHEDVYAVNTEAAPMTVAPVSGKGVPLDGGCGEVLLKPLSWNVLRFEREE